MKTVLHENLEIENFQRFFETLKHEHPEVLGAEWDTQKKRLKVFYEDAATKLTDDSIRALKIPTVLRFRKKIAVLTIQNATVKMITENEFTVETNDPESVKKEIRKTFSEFEEVTP